MKVPAAQRLQSIQHKTNDGNQIIKKALSKCPGRPKLDKDTFLEDKEIAAQLCRTSLNSDIPGDRETSVVITRANLKRSRDLLALTSSRESNSSEIYNFYSPEWALNKLEKQESRSQHEIDRRINKAGAQPRQKRISSERHLVVGLSRSGANRKKMGIVTTFGAENDTENSIKVLLPKEPVANVKHYDFIEQQGHIIDQTLKRLE